MYLNRLLAAAVASMAISAGASFAGDIMIKDAYARSSTPSSVTGAAFLTIMNHGDQDDRLIAARSDAAKRVELHTHKEDANGVMKMLEVEEGFPIPAGGIHALKRGGDHVMFMGLTAPFVDGEEVTVILEFEKAGEMEFSIPIDLSRRPSHGSGGHAHKNHSNDS